MRCGMRPQLPVGDRGRPGLGCVQGVIDADPEHVLREHVELRRLADLLEQWLVRRQLLVRIEPYQHPFIRNREELREIGGDVLVRRIRGDADEPAPGGGQNLAALEVRKGRDAKVDPALLEQRQVPRPAGEERELSVGEELGQLVMRQAFRTDPVVVEVRPEKVAPFTHAGLSIAVSGFSVGEITSVPVNSPAAGADRAR